MKKILIATTALVATAGFAAAEVSTSAGAVGGLKFDGATDTTSTYVELDFGISGSGESDNGISFGASLDLDTTYSGGTTSQAVTNDPEAFVAFGGATLTLGAAPNASDIGGISTPGFDGIGVDAYEGDMGSADVNFSYDFSGYTAGLSYNLDNDDYALGFEGAAGALSFALAYGEVEATGAANTHLTVAYTAGALTSTVYAEQYKAASGVDTVTNFALSLDYTMNALTVTAAYSDIDGQDDANYAVGAAYSLGGGLTVAGGIGEVAGETAADLGFKMSF